MPKQRITKEIVVNAAFEIAREKGMEYVLAKNIAEKIGCSVQPIYSYCTNMEGLRENVEAKARSFIREYIHAHIDRNDLFRSTGRAHILLAKEEPHIYKILVLQGRKNISSLNDIYQVEANPQTTEMIAEDLGISIERAKQLHLNMLIYSVGLGTIFSVSSPGIPIDEIFLQQDQAYEIFMRDMMGKRE